MPAVAIKSRSFSKEVLAADVPVLVAFRASWCQPSQELVPDIDGLADEFDGQVKVVNVDFDSERALCKRLNVTRIPVTMMFDGGTMVDLIGGATDRSAIKDMVASRLAPVREVGVHNFDVEVLKPKVPTIVHFGARWCSASLQLIPDIEELATSMRGKVKVTYVEFGPDTAHLCAEYGVFRVPTVAVFMDGKLQDQILGAMVGGTKAQGARASCVGLTTFENLRSLVDPFVR